MTSLRLAVHSAVEELGSHSLLNCFQQQGISCFLTVEMKKNEIINDNEFLDMKIDMSINAQLMHE